jgi:hypothetical protein
LRRAGGGTRKAGTQIQSPQRFTEHEPNGAAGSSPRRFSDALAYATDLATGHSRNFALRSCVLGMRVADVAGLEAFR